MKAICPAALSFIFKPIIGSNPLKTGSIGVGATVDKQVTVTVKEDKSRQILFNGKLINFPTVSQVLDTLTGKSLKISIISPLPLGYGFGISAASSLASAFAVNRLLILGKSIEELVKTAHRAEIINHTGLGGVTTVALGGFLLKTKAGIPTRIVRLPYLGQKLYAVIIDKLITPTILSSKTHLQRISKCAEEALSAVKKNKSLTISNIIDISYNFAQNSKLLTDDRVKQVINGVRKTGGHATMAMLGKVVITDTKPEVENKYRVEELTITDSIVSTI